MRILIVEDEKHLADGLRFNLEAEGYEAEVVETGETALGRVAAETFDAIVLDVMLPGIDGFEVARQLRGHKNYVPVLMLTARGRPEDVLQGFEAGTDDYLPKPFDLEIFLARLKGLLRRSEWSRVGTGSGSGPSNSAARLPDTLTINGRTVDFTNLEIRRVDEPAQRLTLMEARLLRYLIENAGRPVSRAEILTELWGLKEDTDTRAIDNFIVRLRRLLEDRPDSPELLLTVRGVGYKFVRPDA